MNARLAGKKPAIRLNGTTDIQWERYLKMHLYPEVQFYDYTKWNIRKGVAQIENYDLTFSRSEATTELEMKQAISNGMNVAVVFEGTLPEEYLDNPNTEGKFKVVDGDLTDLRFLDEYPRIIGLKAKGDAKGDTSGFVVKVGDII